MRPASSTRKSVFNHVCPPFKPPRSGGQRYGLNSQKQARTLAKCVLEFGEAFPEGQTEAQRILQNAQTAGWCKRDQLERWLPRGRIRHALLTPYRHEEVDMQHDHYRPLVSEERS